jgi:hypothetical protein
MKREEGTPGGGEGLATGKGRRGPICAPENFVSKKEAAKERLERNLKSLESYCQPPVDEQAEIDEEAENPIGEWLKKRRVLWPSHELLRQINDDVIELAIAGRKKPILPIWKAFEQVDSE